MAAVTACEAATAAVSRPSSPQDAVSFPIPERELAVRVRLEDWIDQVGTKSKLSLLPRENGNYMSSPVDVNCLLT